MPLPWNRMRSPARRELMMVRDRIQRASRIRPIQSSGVMGQVRGLHGQVHAQDQHPDHEGASQGIDDNLRRLPFAARRPAAQQPDDQAFGCVTRCQGQRQHAEGYNQLLPVLQQKMLTLRLFHHTQARGFGLHAARFCPRQSFVRSFPILLAVALATGAWASEASRLYSEARKAEKNGQMSRAPICSTRKLPRWNRAIINTGRALLRCRRAPRWNPR